MLFEVVLVTALIPKKILLKGYLGSIIQKVMLNVTKAHWLTFILSELDTEYVRVKKHQLLINYPLEITLF